MRFLRYFKDVRVILAFIFILAIILRVYRLSELPNGFFTDEVVSGYVGRFILLNGQDPYGNPFPLFSFDKFGDYRVILPMYITGVFTFIFGVNEFAVRFPPAFFGALFIFSIYFLTRELLGDRRIALLASLFSAILPWHIILSRAQSEGIIGLTVFTFAIYILLYSIRVQKKKFTLAAFLLFALTYLLYPNFRLLSPLVVFPVVILIKSFRWRQYIVFVGMGLLLLSFLVLQTDWGRGRFEQTSFFGNKQITNQILSTIEPGSSPDPSISVARIFHNKYTAYGRELLIRYFDYFSPKFLFLNGGLPFRYSVPDTGLFYIVFLVFFASFVFSKKDTKDKRALLYLAALVILAPLPSLITIDDVPNIHRAIFMIVPLTIICAYGAVSLYESINRFRHLFIVLFSVLLLCEMSYVYHRYVYHAKIIDGLYRDDQHSELAKYLRDEHDEHPMIYSSVYGTIPVYYAFFTNNFDKSLAGKFRHQLYIDQIDNIVFVEFPCPAKINKDIYKKSDLIVQNGECLSNEEYKLVKKFMREDGSEAFRVVEVE
jgi:4-amino-4-deoxy-L-arabinose transferase-like glycosyltransferase